MALVEVGPLAPTCRTRLVVTSGASHARGRELIGPPRPASGVPSCDPRSRGRAWGAHSDGASGTERDPRRSSTAATPSTATGRARLTVRRALE
jgi:hypothetical protein